jgi:hypothetical protein
MSLPLLTSDAAPTTYQPYRLTEKELKLRYYFLAAFNDVAEPDWAISLACCIVTDELKQVGESVEAVIKRVKYIAAIPIAFHYRFGYADAQSRLLQAVAKATSLCIERYFEAADRVISGD